MSRLVGAWVGAICVAVLAGSAGCMSFEFESGKIVCGAGGQCPEGWSCVAGHCYDAPLSDDGTDADTLTGSSADTGSSAGTETQTTSTTDSTTLTADTGSETPTTDSGSASTTDGTGSGDTGSATTDPATGSEPTDTLPDTTPMLCTAPEHCPLRGTCSKALCLPFDTDTDTDTDTDQLRRCVYEADVSLCDSNSATDDCEALTCTLWGSDWTCGTSGADVNLCQPGQSCAADYFCAASTCDAGHTSATTNVTGYGAADPTPLPIAFTDYPSVVATPDGFAAVWATGFDVAGGEMYLWFARFDAEGHRSVTTTNITLGGSNRYPRLLWLGLPDAAFGLVHQYWDTDTNTKRVVIRLLNDAGATVNLSGNDYRIISTGGAEAIYADAAYSAGAGTGDQGGIAVVWTDKRDVPDPKASDAETYLELYTAMFDVKTRTLVANANHRMTDNRYAEYWPRIVAVGSQFVIAAAQKLRGAVITQHIDRLGVPPSGADATPVEITAAASATSPVALAYSSAIPGTIGLAWRDLATGRIRFRLLDGLGNVRSSDRLTDGVSVGTGVFYNPQILNYSGDLEVSAVDGTAAPRFAVVWDGSNTQTAPTVDDAEVLFTHVNEVGGTLVVDAPWNISNNKGRSVMPCFAQLQAEPRPFFFAWQDRRDYPDTDTDTETETNTAPPIQSGDIYSALLTCP